MKPKRDFNDIRKSLKNVNKLGLTIDFLSGKIGFSLITGLIIYHFHVQLSSEFLKKSSLQFNIMGKSLELIQTREHMELFTKLYMLLTFWGILVLCFIFYRSFIERFLKDKTGMSEEIEVLIPEFPYDRDKLQMIVGLKHEKFTVEKIREPEYLIIPEKGMFQNFFITGTIGTGKTASVMYPFLKQAIFYGANDPGKKAGMLILDVKGNFYEQAVKFAKEAGRKDDLVIIKLGGEYKYNPLAKPNMEAVDLAGRSRTVLDLFSGGGKGEKFWDTKAGQMMAESIRLLRITSRTRYVSEDDKEEGQVTLGEIHKIVTDPNYVKNKMDELQNKKDMCSEFDFYACKNYFYGEFISKAENTIATVKACVTEMTSFFASSERINAAFCPGKDEKTFTGFEECINEGKIVILAMNKAKYPQVSRTIAAYLKLDFQSEVQQRTSADNNGRLNKERPMFFFCDEYQEFVTENDADFYGLSRESKCCSIVSSQSYTSVLKTLGDEKAFNTLQQNLINKIWLRSDDKLTIETAQMLTGKEEKEKYSKNISESLTDAKKSKLFGRLESDKASISESVNVSTSRDFVFEEKIFTQELKLFTAVAFTAHDEGMNEPYIVHLMPYFKPPIADMEGSIATDEKIIPEEKISLEKEIVKQQIDEPEAQNIEREETEAGELKDEEIILAEAKEKLIIQLWNKGNKLDEISKMTMIDKTVIRYVLRKNMNREEEKNEDE